LFIGLYETGKMVVNVLSLFLRGELVSKISELVAKLDWEKVKEAVQEIPGAIWKDFTGKWNHPDKTEAAEFRGKVIGYIIAEVVLAILTAGIFTEVKWVSFLLSKLGKASEEILMLINKAREVIGKEARATKYAEELERLRDLKTGARKLISADVGEIIGWGEGQTEEAVQQTINLTKNLSKSQLHDWINKGLTKSWVEKQLASYTKSLLKGKEKLNNKQILLRKELMEKILKLWN
jgi:hypothetical protein